MVVVEKEGQTIPKEKVDKPPVKNDVSQQSSQER